MNTQNPYEVNLEGLVSQHDIVQEVLRAVCRRVEWQGDFGGAHSWQALNDLEKFSKDTLKELKETE